MLWDIPVTSYTCPPVSTDLAIRNRLQDCRSLRQFAGKLPFSAVFRYILPNSAKSAKFCQALLGL